MTAWGIFWLVGVGLFVLVAAVIALALKCFEAGRYHERKLVAENLAEINRTNHFSAELTPAQV